jgi:hypothetical protein
MYQIPRVPKTIHLIPSIPVLLLCLLTAAHACAQQDYVGRYDIYNGYAALIAPKLDLTTRGYHFQGGWNDKTWMAQGFDYSVTTGHTELTPDLLPTALQLQLGQQIMQLIKAGVIPPTYQVYVPVDSTTQTFAAGPQLRRSERCMRRLLRIRMTP